MALPSSGQIAFSNVRTEMSQSSLNDYYFSRWVAGNNNFWGTTTGGIYSPVNYLSSGSRWSLSANATMSRSNLSLGAWYSYDHTLFCSNTATASLQTHFTYNISGLGLTPSSMVIMDAGTSNTTWRINISGSNSPHGSSIMYVYYGKPWNVSGAAGTGSATFITSSIGDPIVLSFNYTYTYDANKGQYIYFVILPNIT